MPKLIRCGFCDKVIDPDNIRYRCCDTNVCSPECSMNKINAILKIDPTLTASYKWNNKLYSRSPIESLTNKISFLGISQDTDSDSDTDDEDYYLSVYDDLNLIKTSQAAIYEIGDYYNKAKIYILQKITKFPLCKT